MRFLLPASILTFLFAAALPWAYCSPLYLDIYAGTEIVGQISVTTDGTVGSAGINGQFDVKAGWSLEQTAAALGVNHFNWYQVVVWDPSPPPGGGGSVTTVPYVDPPPGGYYPGQWGDLLPWYWDEYAVPGPGFDSSLQLSHNTTDERLLFQDDPQSVETLDFATWLVGVDEHDSFVSFYSGFSWQATYDGADHAFTITGAITAPPADALYQDIIGGFLTASPVPEPAAILLALFGLALLPRRRRR